MKQPELGRKISEFRRQYGLTQSELAEQCNINLRTIQRIESAHVTPRSHTLKLIFSTLEYDFYSTETDHHDAGPLNWFITTGLFKVLKELFNLKTNTMKKLTLLSIILPLIVFTTISLKPDAQAQSIKGWEKTGRQAENYNVGLDENIKKNGSSSAFLESNTEVSKGFGTLMQSSSAEDFLNKKVKMTGYIKAENVTNWAGMWMRVDSKDSKSYLSFDNMQDRPIQGTTDWVKCEIILDVPSTSSTINYGFLLNGTGKIWFDDIDFDTVSNLKKSTQENRPRNMDFEN
ncbi:MAG: helix-turn-helix domain-containing protein [Reichenbachiella sp.]